MRAAAERFKWSYSIIIYNARYLYVNISHRNFNIIGGYPSFSGRCVGRSFSASCAQCLRRVFTRNLHVISVYIYVNYFQTE